VVVPEGVPNYNEHREFSGYGIRSRHTVSSCSVILEQHRTSPSNFPSQLGMRITANIYTEVERTRSVSVLSVKVDSGEILRGKTTVNSN